MVSQAAAESPTESKLSTSLRMHTLMDHALSAYQTTAATETLSKTINNEYIAANIAAIPARKEGLSKNLRTQTTESFAYAAELNDRLKQLNSVIAELGKRTHSTNDSVKSATSATSATSVKGTFFGTKVSTTTNNDSSVVPTNSRK